MADIFLSYAREDAARAEQIAVQTQIQAMPAANEDEILQRVLAEAAA